MSKLAPVYVNERDWDAFCRDRDQILEQLGLESFSEFVRELVNSGEVFNRETISDWYARENRKSPGIYLVVKFPLPRNPE